MARGTHAVTLIHNVPLLLKTLDWNIIQPHIHTSEAGRLALYQHRPTEHHCPWSNDKPMKIRVKKMIKNKNKALAIFHSIPEISVYTSEKYITKKPLIWASFFSNKSKSNSWGNCLKVINEKKWLLYVNDTNWWRQ